MRIRKIVRFNGCLPTFAAMIVHLMVGEASAAPLREALAQDEHLSGIVLALPDRLHHGPLHRSEGQSFSQVRAAYWRAIRHYPEDQFPEEAGVEERLIEASNLLQKHPEAQLWFWIAPHAADVTAYYRSLRYLGKYTGRLFTIQIDGLPFLDASGNVFYPQSFSEVPPREFSKARRLARLLSPAELELDSEVWSILSGPDSFYRFLKGGKKLATEEETYFDHDLMQALRPGPMKAARLVANLVTKSNLPTDEAALLYRIRKQAAAGLLTLKGDLQKSPRDWEVSLPQSAPVPSSETPE